MDIRGLDNQLVGRRVSRVTLLDPGRVEIHFADGALLRIEITAKGLAVTTDTAEPADAPLTRATRRQREYLDFIRKYTARYRIPPAESDIERHFLVSAPSVNQMIQTLERRGLITRRRDANGRVVARSIRIVDE